MPFDGNYADQSNNFDLIPAGTLAKVSMTIRMQEVGREGKEPYLTQSKNSALNYLDCEFTVLYGPHANRKFWTLIMADAADNNLTDGQIKSLKSGNSTLRGILESARNINPDDESDQARQGRCADWEHFNGLEFAAKIGIEKGKDGYADKNKLMGPVTNKSKDYTALMAGQEVGPGPAANAPAWGPAATPANNDPAAPPWGSNQTARPATPAKPAPPWGNNPPATPSAPAVNTQPAQPANNGPAWADHSKKGDDIPF